MASQKKVVVRQFDGALHWGYLPGAGVLSGTAVPVLDTAGRVQLVEMNSIKSLAYVRDFNLDDGVDPERLGRRTFASRPKTPGLWLKLEFKDKDGLECLASFDTAFLDLLIGDRCLSVVPPDQKSNTYRLLIPRSAVSTIEVRGLIVTKDKSKKVTIPSSAQTVLFAES